MFWGSKSGRASSGNKRVHQDWSRNIGCATSHILGQLHSCSYCFDRRCWKASITDNQHHCFSGPALHRLYPQNIRIWRACTETLPVIWRSCRIPLKTISTLSSWPRFWICNFRNSSSGKLSPIRTRSFHRKFRIRLWSRPKDGWSPEVHRLFVAWRSSCSRKERIGEGMWERWCWSLYSELYTLESHDSGFK